MAELQQQDVGVQEPHRSRLYSDLSGMYDRVFTRVFASRIETVVSGLGIEPGARVLEVGVGTGLSLDSYPSHCQVTGIDVSEDMLERAREKLNPEAHAHIKLECMDAMDLPFEDGSFDYVTAFHVVTVVPDPARLVREMARICKADGFVVIINHFSSQRRAVRAVVNLVDPLTRRLGWSTRLALDEVIGKPSLRLKNRYKTSPWSLFTVVEARKEVDFLPGS
ncbi:MAG: class I SAM-dependent methyltransferase [Proteobacteria bacterium]|nr:class I SAM-dependent methyltransferase [Pseudomonadota bacterium]